MINKDDDLEGYARNGEMCDFLKDYKDFVEISAQKIRELLLDPKINNVRITGAVITDTLDLRDTLSAEGSPLGGLELINCVILEPLRLERSHLTHLSLLQSAFTELHAQNCRIEGPVDLGYVYSREEPESRSFKDNPEYSNDNRAIDEAFKNIPVSDKGKTGLSGPDNWWKYETALETKPDSPKTPRGRCQVKLSEASIGGSLYLDGCRLIAPADEENNTKYAINLSNSSIDGSCIVRGIREIDSAIPATSGSFLGRFNAMNLNLQGDFWGCGGIYWGDSERAVFFQGARIKGGVFFQEIKKNQSSNIKQPNAVIRGELNFLGARIEGWADLRGLHCVQLIFATATIGSNFWLNIEDKSKINLLQNVDLRSMKVSGDFSISIENYSENNTTNGSQLTMDSSEVIGNFTLQGDIGSHVSATNMGIGGLCSITAHFRNNLALSNLKTGGDFEFDCTIHKTLKNNAGSEQVILDGTEVKGDFKFDGDIDAAVSAKNVCVNGSCLIAAHFRNYLKSPSLKVGGNLEFSSTIDKFPEIQEKNNSTDTQANQNKGNTDNIQVLLDGAEVSGYFKFTATIDATVSARNMHISGFCSIEDNACFKEDVEFRGLKTEGDVRFYPTIHKKADLSGIHVRGSLYLSRDLEKGIDNFKSIKLVHKITIKEWRRFADLQSSRENFLNACLNSPTCQLILKHAVIQKELRIHRLQTELGDTDTNLINWTGRIREFFRKPLRLLISYRENLPDKLRNRFVKWAKNKLDRLYGFHKQVIVSYCSDELSFYPDFYWIRCYVEQKTINHVIAGGLIDCLWNPDTKEIVIVGGKSAPIHQLNHKLGQQGNLKLETLDQVKDYLRFFCECVWGDQGPFHIYEIPHESDNAGIKQLIKEIVITEEKPEYWVAKTHVIYADYVFNATFHIYKNGLIQMEDDEPIRDGVNIRFQFSESYRYDSSGKNTTLKAIRPLKLNLHNANRKEVRNNISSLLPSAEKSFSEKINLLPTPPLFNGVPSIFYKYSGKFRRWLDRYELFLPMQLPVIDLRGAHVETLNDRRGNGWRNPESFKFNHNWLNYGIFLRLEGFTFNRLIHIVEPIESNAAANFESNDTDNENMVIENFQSSSEISAPNKNQSPQKKQPSPAPPPSALNDQNWKARLGWLYQQYPQGVPDPYTFDQQPFSQVIKAYRSRGDIANVNGILRAKISIEFMLFAQRVTPMFLLVFSFFAGIVFMIATHTMTSAVNENLWPVALGVIAGALSTLIFCREQDKLDRNYFIFLIVPAVLVITYLASGLLFINHPAPASVFFTQMLFLSIVIWGIGVGRLIVYTAQIIYWICFDYGLSIFRALLTILICLAIGAWGVNTVNNDKKFLVLNVDYATPFVDDTNQPHFMRIKPAPEDTSSLQEQTQSAAKMECGKTIDPFIYALDVFISLVDLRHELLCNLRSAEPTKLEEKNAEWSMLLKQTTWDERRDYLLDEVLNTNHPQMWVWLAAAYTILGWVVISLTILTIARNIKNYLSDNNQ